MAAEVKVFGPGTFAGLVLNKHKTVTQNFWVERYFVKAGLKYIFALGKQLAGSAHRLLFCLYR
jgi:hypothetical protein